jgi:hypothetical protein
VKENAKENIHFGPTRKKQEVGEEITTMNHRIFTLHQMLTINMIKINTEKDWTCIKYERI